MNILLLSNMYPSKKDGLFGVFVKNFKEKLESQGANFTNMVVIKGKTSNPAKKTLRYAYYYTKVLYQGVFSKADFIYVHYLSHNAPLIIMLGTLFKKTIVVNIHGSDISEFSTNSLVGKLNKKALLACKLIVVPSFYFSEILKKGYLEKDFKKVVVYPSGGINLDIFRSIKNETIASKSNLKLVLTSRIDSGKGWDVFLRSISLLIIEGYHVTATIIGQGNKEKEMESLIQELKLQQEVTFLGLLAQNEISKIYADQHVFVFPTLLNESLGLVGLEAMACGLPVIGSNIGAPSAYIKEGENGFLFEPNNASALSQKIKAYVALEAEAKIKLQKNAIATAQEYESNTVTKKLFNHLKPLC
jgi:glycosyltransferase involved in cell wall biosynthesis